MPYKEKVGDEIVLWVQRLVLSVSPVVKKLGWKIQRRGQ